MTSTVSVSYYFPDTNPIRSFTFLAKSKLTAVEMLESQVSAPAIFDSTVCYYQNVRTEARAKARRQAAQVGYESSLKALTVAVEISSSKKLFTFPVEEEDRQTMHNKAYTKGLKVLSDTNHQDHVKMKGALKTLNMN